MAPALKIGYRRFSLEIVVLIVCYTVALIYRFGNLSTFRRGFFCDDESIRYPFKGETILEVEMAVGSYVVGLAVILITEYVIYCGPEAYHQKSYFLCTTVPAWIYFSYKYVLGFMFALAIAIDIKSIVSFQIGRLRPCFLDLCQPDLDLTNCTGLDNVYLTNYTCNLGFLMENWIRQSFFSAHTAYPACATAFVILYIHSRWNRQGLGKILAAFVSIILVIGTLVCGVSRISDNLHHPSDVITGLLLGTIIGLLTARYVCGLDCSIRSSATEGLTEENSEKYPIVKSAPSYSGSMK